MMRSKLSWALILIVLSLAPSEVSAQVNEKQLKNPTPSPSKSSNPPQQQSAASDQQADPNQRQPAAPPIFVNILPPQKTQAESDREAKAQDDKASSDWWMILFNGLLAAFTLCLVVIGAIQGRANWKAAEAARLTAESLIASERAYVFAKLEMRAQIISDPNRNCTTFVHALFMNHGKTPAVILHMSGAPYMGSDVPQQLHTVAHMGPEFPDGLVIAASNGYQFEIGLRITTQELQAIEAGTIKLFCAGLIRYKDIMGNERETGYCWEYMPAPHERRFRFCDASRLNYYT